MKKIITLIFFLGFSALYAHEISGVLKDVNNLPIEGVNVYNQTNGSYTFSSVSGYFELDGVELGDILVFSSLGYAKQEITITDKILGAPLNLILEEAAVSLDQVVLVSKVNAISNLVNMDIIKEPIKSSQEVLRKVPGLIIGQHAGGGKAEQIFLRGFDVDHGTDIAINVDGLPVNMVSHAHGQGYADLHFVIPETIDNIDFGKGPYYAYKGNFNTAGYIDLNTKERIEDNIISLEAGQFNTIRALNMTNILKSDNSSAYLASEMVLADGFFDSPQDFNRFNVLGRFSFNNFEDEKLTLSVSHFQSKWTASGQIPQRAVDQGLIGRFGAIDDTEGGSTSRSNLLVNHRKQLNEHESITSKAYVTKYDFELFSNFTFFLENPVAGDQIQQHESRAMIGAESIYGRSFHLQDHDSQLNFNAGVGFRYDDVNDIELSRTQNRRTILERLAFGEVDELNAYGFFDLNYKSGDWTFNPGLRLDYFKFDHVNFLTETFDDPSEKELFLGPKLNIIYTPSEKIQWYAKSGIGFHSNDTRVVTANTGERTLPNAVGADVGTIWKPFDRFVLNTAIWTLFLQQEFVYVGDEAVVEPSGRTRRYGMDFGFRYQLLDWLYLNGDINYTNARSTDEPEGADYIPLAPDLTSSGGISVQGLDKFSGGINYRYVDDRPANEDNSIVAEGYFVTDMNINYTLKNWTFGLIVENLFDVEWNETQFATLSRLQNEVEPVEEIHFTPGTPFFVRGKVSVRF